MVERKVLFGIPRKRHEEVAGFADAVEGEAR
jgi:hypothetical protein